MKKILLLSAISLICAFEVNAQAWYGHDNGVSMVQDEAHLYLTSPEAASLITMDKETGHLSFAEIPVPADYYMQNVIVSGAVTYGGEVWLTYGDYVSRFTNGQILETHRHGIPQISPFESVTIASDGTIWGARNHMIAQITPSCAVSLVNEANNSTTGTLSDLMSYKQIPSVNGAYLDYVFDIKCDSEGNLWTLGRQVESGVDYQALCCLRDNTLEAFTLPGEFNVSTSASVITFDNEGSLWFNAAYRDKKDSNCLIHFDGSSFKIFDLPEVKQPINDFKFDNQGGVWVLSWGGHVFFYENLFGSDAKLYEIKPVSENDDNSIKILSHLEINGETIYISGSHSVKTGAFALSHMRPILVTIKDGQISYAEIGPDSDSKSLNAISSVSASTENTNALFDLQGRRLTAEPAQGVYIQNGRKIIR